MEPEAMRERATAVLSAWNEQDVDRVVACYTEDCIYRDPNTRGAVAGRDRGLNAGSVRSHRSTFHA